MASKQTYICYVCKRNGFNDVRVYLDGKTEDGKTIYKNEDMSSHQHKQQAKQQQQQSQQGQAAASTTTIATRTSSSINNNSNRTNVTKDYQCKTRPHNFATGITETITT